jgi:hypothetical protein
VLSDSSEVGGLPREIIPIKIGIDLRSFHWVQIAFLPTSFIEDPNLLALKITPKLLKREFFSKIAAHTKNNLHRLDDSHDTWTLF